LGIDSVGTFIRLLAVLTISHLPDFVFAHQIPETDFTQELMNLVTEIRPEMVGKAFLAVLAVTFVTATRSIKGLTHSVDHFGHENLICGAAQAITATGATHTYHQFLPAQAREKLLQVRKGNFLSG
jgi:hypothetical protein